MLFAARDPGFRVRIPAFFALPKVIYICEKVPNIIIVKKNIFTIK